MIWIIVHDYRGVVTFLALKIQVGMSVMHQGPKTQFEDEDEERHTASSFYII